MLFRSIENIEWLASDLQVILLKTLSSSILLTNDNKMRPVHFDLLSSASNNHWQTSRTSELLSLMLSTNHLSLKSLVDENAKLQPLIIRIIARLGLNHDGLLSINDAAMTALLAHHWPGNYLEVFQTIENAVMKCSHHVITELDLPTRASAKIDGSEMENISDVERRIISYAWQKNNGQLSLICHELGFSRTTLWRKMKKLNLNKNTLPLGKLQRVCND